MSWYVVLNNYDSKGETLFRQIGVTRTDSKKFLQWHLDHQKGREFVKSTFGEMHYQWRESNEKPIADFPPSSNPSGDFSQKAVNVLRFLLEKHGDLHSVVMDTGEHYFVYDCWSRIDVISLKRATISDGGYIESITIDSNAVLPEVFKVKDEPNLIVNENFKQVAEKAGLTGMVFSPVQINTVN